MSSENILIVEDDTRLVDMLSIHFERNAWSVDCSLSAEDAIHKLSQDSYDLVILDRNLPGMDGLALCKKIRDSDDTIMILMLTAYSDELDLVVGLECGADDYVGKPFKLAELIARIRALLRRVDNSTSSSSDSVLSIGTLNIDSEKREVRFSNDDIQLTAKEFDVLWLLANNPSRVFSRSQILNAVWKSDLNCYESSINTIIKRIRRKCSEVGMHADFIETVRGVGYRFVAENAE